MANIAVGMKLIEIAWNMDLDDVLDACVKRFKEKKDDKYLPVMKYNLLAEIYTTSTVLLTMAVAALFFGTFGWVMGLSVTGLIVRNTSERKLDVYTFSPKPNKGLFAAFQEWIKKTTPEREKIDHISTNLGLSNLDIELPETWAINGPYGLWKNRIPL